MGVLNRQGGLFLSQTQLTNTAEIYGVSSSAVSKAYEFVTSNFSFFRNQWMNSEPVRYELPPDFVPCSKTTTCNSYGLSSFQLNNCIYIDFFEI